MPDPVNSASHPPALAWLLVPNAGPAVLSLFHQSWVMASLLYCLGNGLWIALSVRRTVSRRHEEKGLTSVWVPCLLMTAGSLSWAWLSQPAGTLNDGLAWDGRHYAALYSYFATGTFAPIVPEFPYSQRIGLPFLAAHLPWAPRESFLVLHAVFWSATMVVFAICCRLCFGLSAASIYFGVLWLQILWLSIPRATVNYSFSVDSAALFFMQAWIFLLLWGRWRWLLPLCAFVGVLFKETVLLLVLLSVVVVIIGWLTARSKRAPTATPSPHLSRTLALLAVCVLAGSAARAVASGLLPLPAPLRGQWDIMLGWLALRVWDPLQIVRYLAAGFAAYGGFALLWIATIGKPRVTERRWTLTFATVLCPLYFAVCFIAGSDLTKFAFMAFPFALPILLRGLDEVSPDLAVLALLLGLPAAHVLTSIIPELPGQALPSGGQNLQGIYSWMMEYAHPAIVGSWMAWWLGGILVLRVVGFSSVWRSELHRGHGPMS
jgi:hypothetical protein